jgi:hypothetical protein
MNINLHTFSAGCAEVDRMLVFRDWLRTNAADRELYARTKRELATRDWKYMQQYADAKTAVVREIMARAGAAAPECLLHRLQGSFDKVPGHRVTRCETGLCSPYAQDGACCRESTATSDCTVALASMAANR